MARDESKHIPTEALHQQALHRDEATNTVEPIDAAEEVEREVAEREQHEQEPRRAESVEELLSVTERAVDSLLALNDVSHNPAAHEAVLELSRTLDVYLGGVGNEPTWFAGELASGSLSKEGATIKERFTTELSVRFQHIGDALFQDAPTLQSRRLSSRSELVDSLRHISKGLYDGQQIETVFQLIEGLSAEAQPIPTEVHPPDITDPQYEQYLVDNLAAMRREYGIELTKGDFFARRAAAAVHELDILAESYDEHDDAGEPEHSVVAAAELLASWIDEHGTHFEQARTDAGLTRAVQSTHFFRGDTTEAIQLLRAADTVKQADPQLALRLFGVVAGEEGGREKPSDLFGNPLQLAMVRSQKILDKKHVVTDGSALASHALKGLRTFEQGPQGVYGHSVELPSLPDDALERIEKNKEALLFPDGNLDHVSLVMLSRYFPTLEMRRFMTEAAKESVEEEYMRELAEGTPDEFLSALQQMPLELCQSDDVLAIVEQRLQLRHPDVQFRKHVLDALAMYDHSIKYSFTDTIRIRPESVAPTREDIPALINGMRMRHTPHPDADLQASNNYVNPDEHRLRMVLWTSTPKAELLRHAKEFFENYAGGTRYLFRGATSHADLDGELFRVDSLAGAISVVPQPDVLTVEDWKQMIDAAVPDGSWLESVRARSSNARKFKDTRSVMELFVGRLPEYLRSAGVGAYVQALNRPEARPGLLPAALDHMSNDLLLSKHAAPLAHIRLHRADPAVETKTDQQTESHSSLSFRRLYNVPAYRDNVLRLLTDKNLDMMAEDESEEFRKFEATFQSMMIYGLSERMGRNAVRTPKFWIPHSRWLPNTKEWLQVMAELGLDLRDDESVVDIVREASELIIRPFINDPRGLTEENADRYSAALELNRLFPKVDTVRFIAQHFKNIPEGSPHLETRVNQEQGPADNGLEQWKALVDAWLEIVSFYDSLDDPGKLQILDNLMRACEHISQAIDRAEHLAAPVTRKKVLHGNMTIANTITSIVHKHIQPPHSSNTYMPLYDFTPDDIPAYGFQVKDNLNGAMAIITSEIDRYRTS